MRFHIKTTSGGEVKWAGRPDNGPIYYGGPPPESGCWKLDMPLLEDRIQTGIGDASFGAAIDVFVFGFEIAELEGWGTYFTSLSDYTSYRPKNKTLIAVGQLNWPDVKGLDAQAQLDRVAEVLLTAIARVGEMKRQPKHFDVERFLNTLRSILQ
jgi:hypothetical protein